MKNLVTLVEGKTVTTSLLVAEAFEKRHADVIKAIKNVDCSTSFQERNFALILKTNDLGLGRKRKDPIYIITRDGFTFLAMGFTGPKAARFKEEYIKQFNEMEKVVSGQAESINIPQMIDLSIAKLDSDIAEMKKSMDEYKKKLKDLDDNVVKMMLARTNLMSCREIHSFNNNLIKNVELKKTQKPISAPLTLGERRDFLAKCRNHIRELGVGSAIVIPVSEQNLMYQFIYRTYGPRSRAKKHFLVTKSDSPEGMCTIKRIK